MNTLQMTQRNKDEHCHSVNNFVNQLTVINHLSNLCIYILVININMSI